MSRQAQELVDVSVLPRAPDDAVEDLEHALGALAAGRALAARFVLREVEEEPGDVDHAVVLVEDDHAAAAHDGAGRR